LQIPIDATTEEIAALVVAAQERQEVKITIDGAEIWKGFISR